MTPVGERIGVIAGSGHLPLNIARSLSGAGKDVYVAGLKNAADPAIEAPEWETGWYESNSLQGLLDGLARAGVAKVALAGRVGHDEIFHTRDFDPLLLRFLHDLKDHRPSTILGGLVELLAKSGLEVLPLTDLAPDLLPAAGHLAGPGVPRERLRDLDLGWRIARGMADMDIGQTAIVKDGAVVAVEAMEGTDRAIERAGKISSGGLTVVKLAAGDHDFRYDVPTVGPNTIESLTQAGGNLLVVETRRSFLLGMDQISELCDEGGITLLAFREAEDGGVHWPES